MASTNIGTGALVLTTNLDGLNKGLADAKKKAEAFRKEVNDKNKTTLEAIGDTAKGGGVGEGLKKFGAVGAALAAGYNAFSMITEDKLHKPLQYANEEAARLRDRMTEAMARMREKVKLDIEGTESPTGKINKLTDAMELEKANITGQENAIKSLIARRDQLRDKKVFGEGSLSGTDVMLYAFGQLGDTLAETDKQLDDARAKLKATTDTIREHAQAIEAITKARKYDISVASDFIDQAKLTSKVLAETKPDMSPEEIQLLELRAKAAKEGLAPPGRVAYDWANKIKEQRADADRLAQRKAIADGVMESVKGVQLETLALGRTSDEAELLKARYDGANEAQVAHLKHWQNVRKEMKEAVATVAPVQSFFQGTSGALSVEAKFRNQDKNVGPQMLNIQKQLPPLLQLIYQGVKDIKLPIAGVF